MKKKKNPRKEIREWANQKVTLTCKMHEWSDLMDLLYMADGGLFDNGYFRNTLEINKMEDAYSEWLNKTEKIVYGKEKRCKRTNRNKK